MGGKPNVCSKAIMTQRHVRILLDDLREGSGSSKSHAIV